MGYAPGKFGTDATVAVVVLAPEIKGPAPLKVLYWAAFPTSTQYPAIEIKPAGAAVQLTLNSAVLTPAPTVYGPAIADGAEKLFADEHALEVDETTYR
jgi:hypothetical protein